LQQDTSIGPQYEDGDRPVKEAFLEAVSKSRSADDSVLLVDEVDLFVS
jgi:4-aminobutyrate aminotransferase-like enzyme